VKAEEP